MCCGCHTAGGTSAEHGGPVELRRGWVSFFFPDRGGGSFEEGLPKGENSPEKDLRKSVWGLLEYVADI